MFRGDLPVLGRNRTPPRETYSRAVLTAARCHRIRTLPLRVAASFPSRKFRSTASIYEKTGLAQGEPVRSMALQNLVFSWSYHLRLASLLSSRQRTRLIKTVHTSDQQQLSQGLGVGPGLVLVSAHLGDFEIAGAWLRQCTGREVVAVVDTVSQRVRQWFFDATRRACGVTLRRAENTSIVDLEADLLAGRIVVLMLDRRGAPPSVPVTLFETPAEVSVLPCLLSSRTGAPIMVAATITLRSGARRIYFSAPLTADQRSARMMQEITHTMAAFIRCAPQQWHVPADTRLLPLTEVVARQQSSSRDAHSITCAARRSETSDPDGVRAVEACAAREDDGLLRGGVSGQNARRSKAATRGHHRSAHVAPVLAAGLARHLSKARFRPEWCRHIPIRPRQPGLRL